MCCWVEKQIFHCLLCGAAGVPDLWVLGCPFGLTKGDCNLVFETTVNITRDHPTCVALDQLCREVCMRVPPGETSEPFVSSSYTIPAQAPTTDLSLPAGWIAAAVNTDTPSDALNLATRHRDDLVCMMEDLVPAVRLLNATVAPLDPRLRVVIEWCEGYMAGMIVLANTHIVAIQSAEFEIANNTAWSDQAQMDIAVIVDGIINHLSPFEGALIWHRRLTDLFVHLRRMTGELSPPRPAGDDVTPIRRRRGAVTGLDDPADDHSDFLPPPEFHLPEATFPDDGEPMEPAWDEFDS